MVDGTPSPALLTRHRGGFPFGTTIVTTEGEASLDTGIDFSIVKMRRGERIDEASEKESAWVLLSGKAFLEVDDKRVEVSRSSLFDESPWVVHLPAGAPILVEATGSEVEWALLRARNEARFDPKVFRPADVESEARGKGLVQDAALRTVRLVFDSRARPESALVVGEVVNLPGRWSSYPPHHHPQPEIYHYRFTHPQGYGHAELGEEVMKVRPYDTLKILDGRDHPQCAAPGYGMYYLWVVRHQPGAPYTGFTFDEAHRWVLDAREQGWRPKEGA